MSQHLVRPYLLTGGRTRVEGVELHLETLLTTTPAGRAAGDARPAEEHRLLALCEQPTALAELAATVSLPLGVVRVLAGDLVQDGALDVGETAGGDEVPLLERLLDGLKGEL